MTVIAPAGRATLPDSAPAAAPAGWTLWRELIPAGVVLAWIPAGLGLDSLAGLPGQRLLGLLTWLLLLGLLRAETPRTRAQVAVVVVFATLVEYCFAGWLGVYVYRLHNVPWFVPPGHGLVYLAALCIGRSTLARRRARPLVAATIGCAGLWALWGVTLSPRPDVLGAFWFGCLVMFLLRGRLPLVFVGAFLVVSLLEILGTSLGTWRWSVVDPVMGWVSMGNPPSGASGGYGWFDAAGIVLAPRIVRLLGAGAERFRSARS
ncbi:MAG: hypothetical protein M3042_02975 [Actinomycetota bacterium]|nr:hypothetical protein [Actinomycetota bacterium]